MNLQATLQSMKEQAEARMGSETVAAMHKATAELATSGIMDKVLKPGEKMPDFTLLDQVEQKFAAS